jgi:hypothetical protein
MKKDTLNSFYTKAYSSIRSRSKKRGEKYPPITKTQLIDWLLINNIKLMWTRYVESGYNKDLRPSIDRPDDYLGYSFSNMQLITWRENLLKGVNGEKHHKNCHNRQNRKEVVLLVESLKASIKFKSIGACAEWLGVHPVSVSRVLIGVRKTIKTHKVVYA